MNYAHTNGIAPKPLEWWYNKHATPEQHSVRELHSFGAFRRSVAADGSAARALARGSGYHALPSPHVDGNLGAGGSSGAEGASEKRAPSLRVPSRSAASQGSTVPDTRVLPASISAGSVAAVTFPAAVAQKRPNLPQLARRHVSKAAPSASRSPKSRLGDAGRRQFLPMTGVMDARQAKGVWRTDGSVRPKRGGRKKAGKQSKRDAACDETQQGSEFSEQELLAEVNRQRHEARRNQRLARRALELRAETGELDALRILVRADEDARAFAKSDIGRRRHERRTARNSLKSRKAEGRNTMFSYLA